ncbi:hypothetical protein PCASD_23551 [Puccinia coronata f. sp. avenae]|uniref:Uncharacterized protein n=1 Tax=Puccinia coronata f. sp. avenae TaxID=200324 RepID=A0A2N5SC01_9BASI|nr:hypothetical protein PCASD_23551 [Puccinia coronata f. sp. avenae]
MVWESSINYFQPMPLNEERSTFALEVAAGLYKLQAGSKKASNCDINMDTSHVRPSFLSQCNPKRSEHVPRLTQPTAFLLIAYRSLSVWIYSIRASNLPNSPLQVDLIRTTSRAHEAPILVSTSDPTGRLFATGDTAGVVRVWDARAGYCTHVFKGHGGIISALHFDIDLNGISPARSRQLKMKTLPGTPLGSSSRSGSQDKLAKLFSVDHSAKMGTTLKLAGVLKGHSRGIWSIKFSKHDPYVMTGSGDCTIKLWSTDQKMRKDSQAEQGVMTICVATLGDDSEDEEQEGFVGTAGRPKAVSNGREGKIWALDLEDWTGSQMVSGGADSRLIYWRDVTRVLSEKKIQMKEAELAVQQDLENFVRAREFGAPIRLLIKLDKPARLLRLFTDLERAEGNPDAPDNQFGPVNLEADSD